MSQDAVADTRTALTSLAAAVLRQDLGRDPLHREAKLRFHGVPISRRRPIHDVTSVRACLGGPREQDMTTHRLYRAAGE